MRLEVYGEPAHQLVLQGVAALVWNVNDVIRKLREDRDWKQQVLAKKAGLHLATVARVESGRETKTETIVKIAAAFGLSVGELYTLIPVTKEPMKAVEQQLEAEIAQLPRVHTEKKRQR